MSLRGYRLGTLFLYAYTWFIGYRFQRDLGAPLRLPKVWQQQALSAELVQEKARASLASSAAFLGFSIAVIVALVGADRARERLQECGSPLSLQIVGCVVGILILLYSVIRLERYISKGSLYGKARKNQLRTRGYVLLCVPAFLSFFLFLGPSIWPDEEALLREWLPMRKVFPLSGCVLIVSSACLLLLSLNFYDSAAGWRRGRNVGWLFHLASIASASYVLGLSLALISVSLLLCLLSFRGGCAATFGSLFVIVAMIEIERNLGDRR
jgi:hypothetical protein